MPCILRARSELAEQPAFADARFAGNQYQAARLERSDQRGHLRVATDEDRANIHGIILAAMR
jgi:hypothetical protein